MDVYRAGSGCLRRVTPNQGNGRVIRGGLMFRKGGSAGAPVFIGPAIVAPNAALAVPYSFDVSVYFTGAGEYGFSEPFDSPLSINPATGVISGTPNATGNINPCRVTLQRGGDAAHSNEFGIQVTP